MTIKQLERVFLSELDGIYPKTEIHSFFYILAEAYLDLKRVNIALNPNFEVKTNKFHKALNDLLLHKPIQYILKKTEFYGLNFIVDKNVLIPRPETEELVDWIISDNNKELLNTNKISILDIGTGSGCIAVSLAKNIKNAQLTAFDISKKALKIANKNAENNQIKIHFIEDDILNTKYKSSKFDVIVSNPPYVRELEKKEMQKNVLENEPSLALFVTDENPLLFYNAIANFALNNLQKNGLLYLEINQYLGKETIDLLHKKGFKNIELKKDIFGVDRMIKCST